MWSPQDSAELSGVDAHHGEGQQYEPALQRRESTLQKGQSRSEHTQTEDSSRGI